MHSEDPIRSIYFLMQENATQFSYQGPISQDILASLGDAIKARLALEGIKPRSVRRIFSVLVELAHNVLKYSTDKMELEADEKARGRGILGIQKPDDESRLVFCGNPISAQDAAALAEKLEKINAMSAEELSQSYQKQLKEGSIAPDGSAGLGLYDISRKSLRPIYFEINELTDGRLFLLLKIRVATAEA